MVIDKVVHFPNRYADPSCFGCLTKFPTTVSLLHSLLYYSGILLAATRVYINFSLSLSSSLNHYYWRDGQKSYSEETEGQATKNKKEAREKGRMERNRMNADHHEGPLRVYNDYLPVATNKHLFLCVDVGGQR